MEVKFDEETMKKLEELSVEANLTPEGLIELVMHQWSTNIGSRVYTGRWSKGFRYVVQWPFKPGFVEVPEDQVSEWRRE